MEMNDDLVLPGTRICRRVQQWLTDARHPSPWFCAKEELARQLQAQLQKATSKSERKKINKEFDARRQKLVQDTEQVARENLVGIFKEFFALRDELEADLVAADNACRFVRDSISALQDRGHHCRVFYDGTGDDAHSNFKQYRFAVGPVGFCKGEQFFHVAKALLCDDLDSAVKMMATTSGPTLRSLGREVSNYREKGSLWEDIDSGLLLLVNATIKIAQLEPPFRETNSKLGLELERDAENNLYIAEGAKDDSRCGIGIHATDSRLYERMDEWGRNVLGHACMVVAHGRGASSWKHAHSRKGILQEYYLYFSVELEPTTC